MIRAVTFDVTGTLIHCPRLGAIYAEILGRHGIAVPPEEAERLVRLVWQELACLASPDRDRFRSHPEGARGFWQRFLERLVEHLELPPPSRFAAAELFHRFGGADAWEVYPEVPGVLRALRAQGLCLGVISNWDERLPALLERLGISPFFDVVVYSADVGVEKPDRRIFAEAVQRLGMAPEAGSTVLHVGDRPIEDVEGAIAAGLQAVGLDRARRRGGLPDLSALLERLLVPASRRSAGA